MATKRQLKAEKTREELLAVGTQLLNEKGYDAVTIDEVVERCGVAKGTFYHHFKSKSEFFASVQYLPFVDLDTAISKDSRSPMEAIRRYIVDWIRALSKFSPHYLAGWLGHTDNYEQMSQEGELAGLSTDFARARQRSLTELLDRAVSDGVLAKDCPTDDIAYNICSLLFGTTVWYCLTNGNIDLDEFAFSQADLTVKLIERYRS